MGTIELLSDRLLLHEGMNRLNTFGPNSQNMIVTPYPLARVTVIFWPALKNGYKRIEDIAIMGRFTRVILCNPFRL